MKSIGIRRIVMGAFVTVMLLTGVGSITADAHGRGFRRPHRVIVYRPFHPFGVPYWYPSSYYRVVDPIAAQKEEGYSDGRSRGKDDAKEGRENNPENHKQFNKSKSFAYREAFLQGYADGYSKQTNKDS